MEYQTILNIFVDMVKVAFPIAIIFNLCGTLCCFMLDFIFPNRRRSGML